MLSEVIPLSSHPSSTTLGSSFLLTNLPILLLLHQRHCGILCQLSIGVCAGNIRTPLFTLRSSAMDLDSRLDLNTEATVGPYPG
jgi:hypothetical protein